MRGTIKQVDNSPILSILRILVLDYHGLCRPRFHVFRTPPLVVTVTGARYLFVCCLIILCAFNSRVSFVVYSLSLSAERGPGERFAAPLLSLPPLRSLRYAGCICDTIDDRQASPRARPHLIRLEHGETLFDQTLLGFLSGLGVLGDGVKCAGRSRNRKSLRSRATIEWCIRYGLFAGEFIFR